MKKTLLTLSLVLYYCAQLFAQSISGEKNPCPGTPFVYEITLPTSAGFPSVSNLSNGAVTKGLVTESTSDGKYLHRISITWANVAGTGILELRANDASQTRYPISVTIKGLGDMAFTSIPTTLPCSFRGDISVTAKAVTNATSYAWSAGAGWINNGSTTTSAVFNISSGTVGTITYTANSAVCNVSKSYTYDMQRTQPTDTVVYSSATLAVCAAGSAIAVTPPVNTTPTGYEWYALPAGVVKINGGDYNATTTLITTSNSVTVTPATATTVGFVKLYSRALYGNFCPTPYAQKGLNVGTPVTTAFTGDGSRYAYGLKNPISSYNVCTREAVRFTPVRSTNNDILAHKWEVVSGSYISMSALTNSYLSIVASASLDNTLLVRYQYKTGCGWSEWKYLDINSIQCTTDPGSGLRTAPTDSITTIAAGAAFTIAPNPASSSVTVTVPVSGRYKGNMLVSVTDVKGTTVLTRTVATAAKFTLDVSSLPTGIYILQVQTGTNKVAKQFVVSK